MVWLVSRIWPYPRSTTDHFLLNFPTLRKSSDGWSQEQLARLPHNFGMPHTNTLVCNKVLGKQIIGSIMFLTGNSLNVDVETIINKAVKQLTTVNELQGPAL